MPARPAVQLLVTKLFAPPPLRRALRRPDLLARLREVLEHPLTLISAPAGYGKTSLTAAWLEEASARSVWLSLDEGDNDEVRFWQYVVASLDRVCPELYDRFAAHFDQPQFAYDTFLVALINTFSGVEELVFVLDDYHLIENERIHAGVAFWLEHLPPHLHFIVISRSEPPLPLAKLRVSGRLFELGADALRFSEEEVAAFFNEVMRLELSQAEVETLNVYTEGWAASLHLAALSLRNVRNSGVIDALASTNRFVFDYLADEVFSQQPPDTQTFLLHAALLERFNAELCASVSGNADARALLERLEQANLFLIPLDAGRTWFRFHPLFAEFLQRRLKETTPERVPELYIRAARWCEAHGLTDEAIRYVLAGGDIEGAVALVERHDRTLLWQRDGRTALRPWLEALPEDVIRARARLSLDHAWLLTGTSETARLEQRLRDAQRLLDHAEVPVDDMRGELAVIRAESAAERGKYAQALSDLSGALGQLTDPLLRGVALQSQGYLLRTKGDLAEAEAVLVEAERVCDDTGNLTLRNFALSDLGEVYKMRGQLRRAARTFERALTGPAPRRAASASGALIGLADVLREQNRLGEAHERVRDGLEAAQRAQYLNVEAYGEVVLARLLEAKGELGEALASLQRAAERATRRGFGRRAGTFNLHRASLHLRRGDTAAARFALDHRVARSRTGFGGLVYARLLFAEGDLEAAQRLLAELLKRAEATGRRGRALAVLVWRARGLELEHKTDEAVRTLARALSLAQPEGFMRVFLDEGEPLRAPLQRVIVAGGSDYAATLLRALPDVEVENRRGAPLHLLTEREQQILALIAEGLSNEAIAETLIRSVGTVKSHTSSIYSKLGVRGRTEAVARARGLGLLE